MTTYSEIWKTLSDIDVSGWVEKRGELDYLSWAWAWSVLMHHFPNATYSFSETEIHPGGTVTVHCKVSIGDCSRTMWLPVMDFKHRPIVEPHSVDINKSKMRCLVKCLAMFGLGFSLFAGEDLPADKPSDIKHTKADPMNRDELVIKDEHKAYAKAFLSSGPEDWQKIVADLRAENKDHEWKMCVWSLLDSKTRSGIKQVVGEI